MEYHEIPTAILRLKETINRAREFYGNVERHSSENTGKIKLEVSNSGTYGKIMLPSDEILRLAQIQIGELDAKLAELEEQNETFKKIAAGLLTK